MEDPKWIALIGCAVMVLFMVMAVMPIAIGAAP